MIGTLLPIVIALGGGVIIGQVCGRGVRALASKMIVPCVLMLMFLVGLEAGLVLANMPLLGWLVRTAFALALFSTLASVALCALAFRTTFGIGSVSNDGSRLFRAMRLVFDCIAPLAVVAAGVLASRMAFFAIDGEAIAAATYWFLLFLILLVGVDLSMVKLGRESLTWKIMLVPALVLAGSALGGVAASFVMEEPLRITLALSSGFGWFSMSGPLVSTFLGSSYGTMALLTDLFRELMALVLLYAMGRRMPVAAVASGGAAAMDSVLPIIRVTCPPAIVPVAVVTGLVLTIAGPMLISFLLLPFAIGGQ
ncbi:lysine exporter LysO family protein [Pinirhizobacter sp.]|uniref:lysine exporter LysO family protein n=1 Tax=Pinirhizobacter sp. TaxID=2950432 RepID=UPI002F4053AC